MRGLAPAISRMWRRPSGVSVAMGRSLVEPNGQLMALLEPLDDGDDAADVLGPVRLGHHVAVGPARDGLLEVGLGVLGEDGVHPHPALLAAEVERLEPAPHDGPGRRLLVGRHRVLEVEDQPVGGGGEGLGDHPLVAAGDEVERSPHAAAPRRRIIAARRHVMTSSPFWLLRPVLEDHDAPLRPRLRLALLHHLGLGVDRVAVEDGPRELDLLEAEVAHRGAERGLAHGEPDGRAEREDAVDEGLAELRLRGGVEVHVERLRVHGEAREQDVVGLGDGAAGLMLEHVAHDELFEQLAGHGIPPCAAGRRRRGVGGGGRALGAQPRGRRAAASSSITAALAATRPSRRWKFSHEASCSRWLAAPHPSSTRTQR